MPQFLTELYLSRVNQDELGEMAGRVLAVAKSATEAESVRYLRSIYVPDDELCLHLFEADSAAAVCAACRKAGIRVDRIVEANEVLTREGQSARCSGRPPYHE
jgi:hypothetical protein